MSYHHPSCQLPYELRFPRLLVLVFFATSPAVKANLNDLSNRRKSHIRHLLIIA